MKRIESANSQSQGPEKTEEADPSLDERKIALFDQHSTLFGGDHILKQLQGSIEAGWDHLDDAQKKSIIDMVADFIEHLDEYHDSYANLKWSASEQRKLQVDDIEKYQAAVKEADEREHILHNTFMDAANILSRTMKKMGLSNDWRGNDMIYDGSSPRAMRDKMRDWMFRIYGEEKHK